MAAILLNRNRQVPAEETPAFGGIAERFRRAGDLDRAIALCRDGLKRFPDQLSARVTLGWALLDSGQHEAARVELEQVLRRAPDNLAAIRGMAELHDRNDGQLLSEEERESWRTEQAAAEREREQPLAVVAPSAPEPPADLFAPIPVTFGDATDETPLEVLNTADQAQLAAEQAAAGPVSYSFEAAPIVASSEFVVQDTAETTPTLDSESGVFALETADTDHQFDFDSGSFGYQDNSREVTLDAVVADDGALMDFERRIDGRTSSRVAALEWFLLKVQARRVALQA